jgi:hypothetical protein
MTEQPKQNWLQKNWKWLVPTGCLGSALLCVLFVGGILMVVTTAIKSSDAYQVALERARANPEVVEALGEPIEPGFMPTGSIEVNGSSGYADLGIPISGPKSSGTIYVQAQKFADEWEFNRLEVEVEGQSDRIDLLQEGDY